MKAMTTIMLAIVIVLTLSTENAISGESVSKTVVYRSPSAFNEEIFVVDEDGLRALRFGSSSGDNQSLLEPGQPGRLPMPYLRSAAVGLAFPNTLERVLMIGLGGGAFASFLQHHLPQVYIDAVEIDPVVAQVAERYFWLKPDNNLRVHVRDGVDYLAEQPLAYDFILLDAYDGEGIPDALLTESFFASLKSALGSRGVIVVNIWLNDKRQQSALISELEDFFGQCQKIRIANTSNDVLFLASSPLPAPSALSDKVIRLGIDASYGLKLAELAGTTQACSEI